MPPSTGFWRYLEDYPPIIVRLAARRITCGKQAIALSHQEIAITSGIRLSRIMEISRMFSFDDVFMGEARLFCSACNFDPTNSDDRERQYDFIRQCHKRRSPQPPYLTRSPIWTSQILPLIEILREHSGQFAPSASPQANCVA